MLFDNVVDVNFQIMQGLTVEDITVLQVKIRKGLCRVCLTT